jgi:acyl-coenzyme A synthetase/AMP-(fatty) acid ligase
MSEEGMAARMRNLGMDGAGTNLALALTSGAPGGQGRAVAVDGDGAWSAGDLAAAAARAAGALSHHGVHRGDRVAIALPAGRAWLQTLLGAIHLGAIAVPVDPETRGARLAWLMEDVAPVAVVTRGPGALRGVQDVSPEAIDGGPPVPAAQVAAGDPCLLVLTSGSTGRPKAAVHAHGPCAQAGYVRSVLGLGPGDRVFSASPGSCALGLFIGILRPLAAGAAVVLSERRPSVRAVLGSVERHGATVLAAVPTFWAQLAAFVERHTREREALSLVRRAVSSGEALPEAVRHRVAAACGVGLLDGFGSAECGDIVVAERPGDPVTGIGRAAPRVSLRVVDEAGRAVTRGERGRLLVRCPTAAIGYWRRPEETRALLDRGWLRTGDLVSEENGAYFYHGRVDGLLKVGGTWLQPADAETCLYEHPAVVEAAVVPTSDHSGLQTAAVFVGVGRARRQDLPGELRRHLAGRLGASAARAPLTLLDRLPRLASGKLDRRLLLERAAA